MTLIQRATTKFEEIDLNNLIQFLRKKYNFTDKLQITIGENKRRKYCGKADDGTIYVNLAYIDTIKDLFDTVAHEFIHVLQIARGELAWNKDGDMTWQGVYHEDGACAPWELEAIFETINIEKELDMIAAIW